MTSVISVAVDEIPPLDHDDATSLAEAEYARLLGVADTLSPQDWQRPTDCAGWSVRDMLGHLLGMASMQADPRGAAPAARDRDRTGPGVGRAAAHRADRPAGPRARPPHHHRAAGTTARGGAARAHRPTGAHPGTAGGTLRPAAARGTGVDRRLPRRRRPAPRPLDAPHRPLPGRRAGPARHAGARRADRRERGRGLGQPAPPAVRDRADGAGRRAFHAGHGGVGLRADAIGFCRTMSGRAPQDGLLRTWVPF